MSYRDAVARQSRERKALLKDQAAALSAYYAKIKERNIQKVIVDCLEKAHIPYMRNRDIKLVQRKDGSLVPARLAESQRGKPDLTVVGLNGKTIWIETKAPKGKLSEDQERWRYDLLKRGHEYFAPRSPADAEAVCQIILQVGR